MRTIFALALLAFGGCLAGCQISLTDQGEFGMRAGYELAFFHRTSRTASRSVAEIQSQPLADWLKRGAPQQTDAVPTGSMAVPNP